MRILFLVRVLNRGGAERQLVAVAAGLRRAGHDVGVAVFYRGGPLEDELRPADVAVHDLRKRGRWDVSFLARLVRLVREVRPHVLHAYAPVPNLVAGAARPLLPPLKIVWGVRSALADLGPYGPVARLVYGLERKGSALADAVIANSEAARRVVVAAGMDARKLRVIGNGVDCDAFRPDPVAGGRLRRAWHVPDGAVVVGLVGRLDPVKDHALFLRAAARVAEARGDARFVCVGGGDPAYARALARTADALGIAARVLWTGEWRVDRAVYCAFDVAVLSSGAGESFPNVLVEAMACSTPCVATASGDVVEILGDTGEVVPPGDPEALARAILDVLERRAAAGGAPGARARDRVLRRYSVAELVRRTESALEEVVSARRE